MCVLKKRTFRNHSTDPVYIMSLWATSTRSVNKHQEFWSRIQALIEEFDPAKLDENLDIDEFLKQPFVRPGIVCLAITDSTYTGYAPTSNCEGQRDRWTKHGVCDYKKGWRHERVGDWLQQAMESSAWPSLGWSLVHNWMPLSPLSLSEAWKAATAGASIPMQKWTECTGNGSIQKHVKKANTSVNL